MDDFERAVRALPAAVRAAAGTTDDLSALSRFQARWDCLVEADLEDAWLLRHALEQLYMITARSTAVNDHDQRWRNELTGMLRIGAEAGGDPVTTLGELVERAEHAVRDDIEGDLDENR